jgi:hypothetical protein
MNRLAGLCATVASFCLAFLITFVPFAAQGQEQFWTQILDSQASRSAS